jgi:hypothetical protein
MDHRGQSILAEADELAAHLWRVPADEHPAYKRAINRLLSLITGVLVVALLAVPARAQGTRADTVLQKAVRVQLDSMARDRSAPQFSKRAQARIDSLTRAHLVEPPVAGLPLPVPIPLPPVDTGARFDGPAELPRAVVDLTYPPGSRRQLRVNGSIQQAIDTAKAGDDVVIPAGTYTANLTLRGCSAGWIVIRGEGLNIPVGTRMTPTKATVLPKLVTATATPVVRAEDGACGYRIVGVEIGAVAALTVTYSLITFGDGDEATALAVPRRLIVDRSYIHGHPTLDVRRGVALQCGECGVVDSWIGEIHSASDAAAVWGWNGGGPIAIQNNTLEASGENIMFGGADALIAGVMPSDITITRNHIVKPLSWKGGPWLIKNLMEFKSAQRVLIEGNVFENSWVHAQAGYAIVWWATDQGGTAPWMTTRDLTFRWNRVTGAYNGFQLTDHGDRATSPWMQRLSLHDNLIGALTDRAIQWNGVINDVALERNTFERADYGVVFVGDVRPSSGALLRANLWVVWTAAHSGTSVNAGAFADYLPGATVADVYVTPGSLQPSTPGVDYSALTVKLAGVVVAP